jgi:beta-glucanase (GH16 family)
MLDNCRGDVDFADLTLQPVCAPPPRWVETFDDEFDGSDLDTSRWTATNGILDWQVQQGYQNAFATSNLSFNNGCLHISAQQKATDSQPYTSGEISSMGKFSQLYGCIETRVRMPKEPGTWPAVYMLPENGTWPPEIDVAEATGQSATSRMATNHWKDVNGVHLMYGEDSRIPPTTGPSGMCTGWCGSPRAFDFTTTEF